MARGLEPAGVEFIAENLDGFVRDLGKADKAQDDLGKSTEKLAGSYRDANGRLRDAKGKFISAGDSAEGAGKKTKKTGEQVEKTGKQVKKSEGAVDKFGKSFSMLGSIVTGVATAMTTFAIQSVAKMGQALVGLAQDSIGVAAEFESSMAILEISASGVEEELANLGFGMEDLSEVTLAVGGDTRLLGVSASGSAESITGLFKAGLTAQDVFGDLQGYMAGTAELGGALRASIDLAAATTLDMTQASDLAAIALSTFGDQAEESGMTTDEFVVMAMDNLVRAADASVAEVEGLAEALKMVGPTAGAMSISIQDTNNALALLSTRGIQGSMAGTSLNRMLLDLGKTTPQATEMMESLGIATYDEQGAMLPLVDIIGQFEIALGDATDAERDAALQAIFTAQGMRSMNVLMGEGIEGWVGMEEAIGGAATMMEQGEARSQTLAAQQEALDGVMETLKIRIGSALLPALTSLTTAFSGLVEKYGPMVSAAFEKIGAVLEDLVNWFVVFLEEGDYLNDFLVNLPGPIQSIVKGLGEFVSHLENFVRYVAIVIEEGDALNDFLTELPEAVKPVARAFSENLVRGLEIFGQIIEFIVEHKEAVIGAIVGIGAALATAQIASTVAQIAKSLVSLTTPLGIVLALAGLIGVAWADNWGGIREIVAEILPKVQEFGQMLAEKFEPFIAEVGPQIMEILGQLGSAFLDVFGSVFEVVVESVVPALQDIWETFQETWAIISEVLDELGIETKGFSSVVELVAAIVTTAITLLGFVISGVLTAVSGTVKFFAEHFQGVWMGIRDVVQGVKEWFEGFKQFWTALFNKDMPGALEGLEKGFKATAKFIKGMVKVIVKSISMPFKGLYKLIEGFVKGVIKFFKNLKKKLVGGSIIPDMMDKIEKVIDTVLEIILKVWERVFEKILDVTQDIFESIERTVDRVMTTVEKIIDTITTAIGGNWEDFVDLLFELWEETWEDIQDAVDTIFSAIEALIDQIAGAIESLWDSFTETLEEVWENAWNAIQSAVDSILNAIEALIASITSTIESTWSTFTSTLEQVWNTAWDAIQDTVDTILSAIESLIDSISGSITSAWESFTSSIQATWEIAWGAIQSFVDTTFNAIKGLIDSISGSIESAWGTFTSAVQSTWEAVWSAIESFVNTTFSNVQTAISTISGAIEGTWNSWIGRLRSAFETMFGALEGIVSNAMGLVRGAVESALSALANILAVGSTLYNNIMNIGHNIANSIRDGVVALWSNVKDALTGALEALGNVGAFAGQVWENVKELGRTIVANIKSGLINLWSTATGVLGALRTKLGELLGSVGDATWNTLKKIGVGIMNMVLQGVQSAGQFATNFWSWLWAQITNWLGGRASVGAAGEETGDKVGNNVMDSMVSSVYSQAGRFTDALDYVMGQASGDWTGTATMQAAAGFTAPLGMAAPAMMAPAAMTAGTEVTIGPNYINDGMDVAEFETRVRQAVSEAI